MNHVMRSVGGCVLLVIGGLTCSAGAAGAQVKPAGSAAGTMKPAESADAQMKPKAMDAGDAKMKPMDAAAAPGIIPSGFGDAVDRDIARVRAATAPFKAVDKAIAAGYPQTSACIDNPPHGAMGFHHQNATLYDGTLEVDKPEVLVYEKMPDGTFKLNGVEYLVPIAAWTRDEAPTIMGQKLKRAEKLGFWYLHVWTWEPSPSGVFADWNPRVKC